MKNAIFGFRGANVLVLGLMALFLSVIGPEGAPRPAWAASDPAIEKCVQALREAAMASAQARLKIGREVSDQSGQQGYGPGISGFLGEIGNRYCFTRYKNWIDGVRTLISAFDLLHMISALLTALWDQLTAFVCDAVVTVANNVLNSICIPLPSIGLPGFSIGGGFDHKYCNGLSAADFTSFGRRPVQQLVPQIPSALELFDQSPLARKLQ